MISSGINMHILEAEQQSAIWRMDFRPGVDLGGSEQFWDLHAWIGGVQPQNHLWSIHDFTPEKQIYLRMIEQGDVWMSYV